MLRYHSLHDNQYLRYFKGHDGRVTTIAMSPKNDMFMSAAEACLSLAVSLSSSCPPIGTAFQFSSMVAVLSMLDAIYRVHNVLLGACWADIGHSAVELQTQASTERIAGSAMPALGPAHECVPGSSAVAGAAVCRLRPAGGASGCTQLPRASAAAC